MNGTTRRRLRLVALAAAIPLALTMLSAPAAVAAPKVPKAPHDQVVHMTVVIVPSAVEPRTTATTTTLATGTYVGDSISYVIAHYTGFRVGPNSRTGYGQAIISSITKAACAGCTWYQANLSITNHSPLTPLATTASGSRTATVTASYCWPWQGDSLHCSLWSQASSWDWNNILGDLSFNPLDTQSTKDKIYGCYKGVYNGIAMRGAGSAVGTIIDGMSRIIHLSPAALAWSSIGGCTMKLLHLQ
jgi:hypothetical protein